MITDDYGNLVPPAHPKTIYERLDVFDERLGAGDSRMSSIEAELAKNTAATKEIADGVATIITLFATLKNGFKVLVWLEKLAKPITALLALGLALWSSYLAYRNGVGGGR